MLLPLTPMAPTTSPLPFRSGMPPGKVINPPLETSKRAARLGHRADVAGVHVEEPRGPCLLDRNVDAAQPGAVHPAECFEVPAGVARLGGVPRVAQAKSRVRIVAF